jgi:hypothetical protein
MKKDGIGYYRFIEIRILHEFEKTKVYAIFIKDKEIFLGEIKWHKGKSGYGFYPDKSKDSQPYITNPCLKDIWTFIQDLMVSHRGTHIKKQTVKVK